MSAFAVRERPMLFNGEMVRAILDGRKTQTRRVIDFARVGNVLNADRACYGAEGYDTVQDHAIVRVPWTAESIAGYLRCPFGQPGDRLWVRETWGTSARGRLLYRASEEEWRETAREEEWVSMPRWRPSIHMPRHFSRTLLEITEVRVERVMDITDVDALAEGYPHDFDAINEGGAPRVWFANLWDKINVARGFGWDANPWAWALTFRRVEAP